MGIKVKNVDSVQEKNSKTNVERWIKNWPINERPRKLLLSKGPDSLSDAGLIAVLLRSGTRGKDAVSMGRELINKFGNLRGLMNAKPADLQKIKGLGPAKVAQLIAAIEITKRQMKENVVSGKYIENDRDVIDYLSLSLQDRQKEFFKVIFLNKGNKIIAIEKVAQGTMNETVINPREVIKRSLDLGAGSIILVHNHPSGNTKPSQNDLDLTEKMVSACKYVDITVLDHIIILQEHHISLKNMYNDIFN